MDADHPHDSALIQRDEISIFGMELVHEATAARVRMLWDFPHKCGVIQAVDLLEFGKTIRLLKGVPTDSK
jgi:hypothetical protein